MPKMQMVKPNKDWLPYLEFCLRIGFRVKAEAKIFPFQEFAFKVMPTDGSHSSTLNFE